jgi:hypothetical protein
MFGLIGKKATFSELAKSAEIITVAENGDYKAFIIKVLDKTKSFSAVIKAAGGQSGLEKFIEIIEDRISAKDYDNIFSDSDQMHLEYGTTSQRNMNVERILICADNDGYIFKWFP